MSTDNDRQTQVVEAVEDALRDTTRRFLSGPLLDTALEIWHDFTDETDVSRTKKPGTWAAALLYTIDRLQMGSAFSQDEAADRFDVSAQSVGAKYRQIAETLDLTMADPNYLPAGLRRQIQRDVGRLPDEIPLLENPQGTFWRIPFGYREDDSLQSAQDRVQDGWEALSDDEVQRAEACFEEALELDDLLADAHEGLAEVAIHRDDLETAEVRYRRAYELARESLGSEAPEAYHWWEQPHTRPYMRAREGLAWVYWKTGRYTDAIEEYEALLRRNPTDNQGVRYVLAPLYQLAGDLDGALEAYDWYARDYPDDVGDPHHTFCWGLALFQDDRRKDALRRWREALFQNVYIAPLLLDRALPDPDVWHGNNLAMPDYAATYVNLFGELWEDAHDARTALTYLWAHSEVQNALDRWIDLSRELARLAASEEIDDAAEQRWRRLVQKRRSIEDETLSNSALRGLLKRLP